RAFSRREALAGICSVAGAAVISGCAVNPVTGKREFMLMSERQEISMGKTAHNDIQNSYGKYNDEAIQNWFNERGQEMAKATHRSKLNYTFTVLDSPVVNAFAVPGGYIYVTRGILGYFNNEAQFAGVLAHELGHVNARHTAARYSKAQLANLTLGIGSIFSEEFAKYAQFASLGATFMFLKFSRDDEREADRLGVEYSSKVGYDAVEMSEFFRTLERMHPGGGSLPAWQSTHPDPGDRINATRKQALTFQNAHKEKKFIVKRNEYLDLINGMIYGDDPRQGYEKDSMFYHPEMKLLFPVPVGWNLTNNPTEVRMSPEKENAVLIFTSAPGTIPQAAANQFAADNDVTVLSNRTISVNGMSGFHTSGLITGDDTEIAILSYFIQKEATVFAFHGLISQSDVETFSKIFEQTAYGFNHLTDESFINVAPEKIQVRETRSTKTLQEALNEFGAPEDQLENLGVINGMELNDSIEAGTKIKIIA
ncbi:M48 family metalloprotease, partial [Candidatus Latescibacterota bacterium]